MQNAEKSESKQDSGQAKHLGIFKIAASSYPKKRYLTTKIFMGQYIKEGCIAKGKSMSKAKKQRDPNRLYDKDAEPQLSETGPLREACE